jgi:hypothetical protein
LDNRKGGTIMIEWVADLEEVAEVVAAAAVVEDMVAEAMVVVGAVEVDQILLHPAGPTIDGTATTAWLGY